jgi:hypothetical protein
MTKIVCFQKEVTKTQKLVWVRVLVRVDTVDWKLRDKGTAVTEQS